MTLRCFVHQSDGCGQATAEKAACRASTELRRDQVAQERILIPRIEHESDGIGAAVGCLSRQGGIERCVRSLRAQYLLPRAGVDFLSEGKLMVSKRMQHEWHGHIKTRLDR